MNNRLVKNINIFFFICLLANPICAVHENGSINAEEPLVWNVEQTNQLSKNFLYKQKSQKNICKKYYKPVIVLILLAGISYAAYHFYEVLYTSCDKMEGACQSAAQEVPNILRKVETNISPLLEFFETANSFMRKCPKATSEFLPVLAEFMENCCKQQP